MYYIDCVVAQVQIPVIVQRPNGQVRVFWQGWPASYWQPRSACQLAAYVLLLEGFCSSFMWMLLTTHCVFLFPIQFLLHRKCTVPHYLKVHCLDKRMWKKQLLICNTEQYQVCFIYCFKLCQSAWLNSASAAFCVKHQNIYICKIKHVTLLPM